MLLVKEIYIANSADIYLNGELTIDFPEDVKIALSSKIKFIYCSLKLAMPTASSAITLLKEQYAVGTLKIKIEKAENVK